MSKHRNNTHPRRNVANSLFITKLQQSRLMRLGKYKNKKRSSHTCPTVIQGHAIAPS